jgi:environmental stress-induced protein Ves
MTDKPIAFPAQSVLPAALRITVPWKNGGGVTSEIAAFPAGSGLHDFGWRISTALVEKPGPFSCFEGIDRILTVLEGRLRLDFVDEGRTVVLGIGESLAFPGDVAVEGTPLDGPVRDLNVMTRRGVWQASMHENRPQPNGADVTLAVATRRCCGLQALDAIVGQDQLALPAEFEGHVIRLRSVNAARSDS